MSDVEEEIISEIKNKFKGHSIWVWYDPRKKYEGLLGEVKEGLKGEDIDFLRYDGSYLELKYNIWKDDPEFEQKWLLYISENRDDAEWLKDIHRLGKQYRPDIKLTDDPAARYLTERTDEIPDEYLKDWTTDDEKMVEAFFCVLFRKDRFVPKDFVIEYLKNPTRPQKMIEKYEQTNLWESILEDEYGIESGLDTSELAKQIIFSELHERSPLDKYEKIAAEKSEKTAKLCDYWQRHDKDTYIKYVNNIREEYSDIEEAVVESKSLDWESSAFTEIDHGLLKLCMDRITKQQKLDEDEIRSDILPLIEDRKEKFWYENGYADFWDVLDHGLEAAVKSKEALKEMNEEKTVNEIISFYDDEGWKIDREYRNYVRSKLDMVETYEQMEEVRSKITKAYMKFLKDMNMIFTEGLAGGAKTGTNQIEYWRDNHPKEATAILICDALRYELAKELSQRIKEIREIEGEINVEVLSGVLPSITSTGMSTHLGEDISLDLNGGIKVEVGGKQVKTKSDREVILEEKGFTVNDLSELIDKPVKSLKDEKNPPRIIFSRYIDQIGEKLDDEQALAQVTSHVKNVEKAIRKLHTIGYTKFYITADHGFIYTEKLPEELKVKPPENDLVRRRFLVNRYPIKDSDEYLKVEDQFFKERGIETNDLNFAFPRGVACFKARGGNMRYLHGGLCLQEVAVPCLVVESEEREEEPKRVKLNIEFPSKITNSIITVEISPEGQMPLSSRRKIILQARKDDKIVSKPKEVEIQGKEKVSLSLKTGMLEEVSSVTLEAIDADTQEILEDEKTPIDLIITDDVGFDI